MDKKTKSANQNSSLTDRSKMILEASIDGFCVFGLDGKFLEVNSSFCEISGYSKEELLTLNTSDIECLETSQQHTEHIERIIQKGSDRFETKHRCKDGTIIDTEVVVQYCDLGQEKFFFSFIRDISEYKRVQKELKANEVRFRTLSDAAFEGIVIHEGGRVVDANRKFVDMFGYTQEELTGMNGLDLIGEQARQTVGNNIASGYEGLYETVGLHKDGSTFPMEIQVRQIQLEGVTYRVAGLRDITERRQLEAERENYKENLLKAQKHAYIASMGSIVAHQISQPLTKINILLDRAIEQAEKASCPPSAIQDVKDGLAEAKEAASIIRQFRQYSRGSALEGIGIVNLGTVADRIVSALSESASLAKMHISMEGIADLPEVEANEAGLEQIFLVLMQNAIEAADGMESHKLDIAGKLVDGNIELQFSDDCCGIAPENIEKIFEPFFSTKPEDKGMGLGLDIAQQVLMSCGGQIRVESQPGKGSVFYVTIPVSDILEA